MFIYVSNDILYILLIVLALATDIYYTFSEVVAVTFSNNNASVTSKWKYSTTICKLVDLIPALRLSDCRIPNWVSAKTVLSCSTNHGQTTARFRSFFR